MGLLRILSRGKSMNMMDRYKINYLYHFTHVDNMTSIWAHGLLSHNQAHQSDYVTNDISNRMVNERRATREVFGRPLHDYVPLYFTPKNPMLYARKKYQDDIAILSLDPDLILREDAIFTDGNAASGGTSFFTEIQDVDKLDWDCIRDEWWVNFEDGTRKRCAEVLLPLGVPFQSIQRIIVRIEQTKRRLENVLQAQPIGETGERWPVEVEIQPRWYFAD